MKTRVYKIRVKDEDGTPTTFRRTSPRSVVRELALLHDEFPKAKVIEVRPVDTPDVTLAAHMNAVGAIRRQSWVKTFDGWWGRR